MAVQRESHIQLEQLSSRPAEALPPIQLEQLSSCPMEERPTSQTGAEEDGTIADLWEQPVPPSVVAPVEIAEGDEDLFHFDAGLSSSRSAEWERRLPGVDFTWSYRAAGADIRPQYGGLASSASRTMLAQTPPDTQSHGNARQAVEQCHMAPAETKPPREASAVAHTTGYRNSSRGPPHGFARAQGSGNAKTGQVFIHGVETHPEYNGRVAWVNIADWDAAVQAEAGPTVLSVE